MGEIIIGLCVSILAVNIWAIYRVCRYGDVF
jgi:hypothetical protein